MDNVTHTLFALTLARTPLGRGRGATTALVLASSAPDCDIVAALSGGASYLEWHRGPTHGPLGGVGLGLMMAAIVWTGRRLLGRRERVDGSAAPFTRLAAISVLAVFAHILMDLPTSYGTRLLSPFSWRWFALDLMPIIDVYLLAILAGGLLLGARSAGRRRASVAIVLTLMAANYALRGFTHQEALKRADRLFSPTLPPPCNPQGSSSSLLAAWPRDAAPGAAGFSRSTGGPAQTRPCLLETAAIPTFVSPFRWRVIAQLSDAYQIYDIDILDDELRSRTPPPDRLAQMAVRLPNHWTALTHEAARASNVRVLLGFARFPQAQVLSESQEGGTVRFTDMRFDTGPQNNSPMQARRSSLFTATAQVGR